MSGAIDLDSLLVFIAPETQKFTAEQRSAALYLAQSYRPGNLPCRKADEAQVYYAAYLLKLQASGTGDGSNLTPTGQAATLLKEGDLAQQFSDSNAAAQIDALASSYYARWARLSKVSRSGNIMTRLSKQELPICPGG